MTERSRFTAPESALLTRLFDLLGAARLTYAVMRNHEPLPDSAGGSDLDLIVAPGQAGRAKEIIAEAIHAAGGTAVGNMETVAFFKTYALGRAPGDDRWWGLSIDVNEGLAFRGIQLMARDVPWPVHAHRGIRVLSDGFAGVLGVLKEVLNNGTAQCRAVRRAFFRHAFVTTPRGFVRGLAGRALANARRYARPSGKVIAVLGVDGSGKSTIIDAIRPVLDDATHKATIVRHLRPTVLPPLARLFKRGAARGGPVTEPHRSAPSGTLGSSLRLGYLSLDYVLGYWLTVRREIAKQPTVVVFDRYAYDMALDPRRFRIALPAGVVRLATKLVPKPDLVLCLHGRPEVLAARKNELPVDEVARQVAALKELAGEEPRAVLVSTEDTVEVARDRALAAIVERCRTAARPSR